MNRSASMPPKKKKKKKRAPPKKKSTSTPVAAAAPRAVSAAAAAARGTIGSYFGNGSERRQGECVRVDAQWGAAEDSRWRGQGEEVQGGWG